MNPLLKQIVDQRIDPAGAARLLEGLSRAECADLIAGLGELAHRNNTLVEVANRVSDTLSLDVLFPRLMQAVIETIGADRSTLFLYDAETGELFSQEQRGGIADEVRFPANHGIAGSVFASGRGEIIPDAYADPRFNREVDQRTGYRTANLVCAPIRNRRREVIGVTQALNKRGGAFDEDDLQQLEALAGQAAAAFENAQVFERLERSQREEALLLEVVSSLAFEIRLDPLLQKIVDAATQLLDAERGSLFLHDPARDELYSRVAGGATVGEIRFPASAGIAECFSTGRPVSIADAYADARFNPEVDRRTGFRTRNLLCLPITTPHGHKVGAMQILNKRGGAFTAADGKRLLALCAQAAVSLENARLFDEVNAARVYSENILRSMANAVLTLGTDGRVAKVNQSAERLLGPAGGTLVGRTVAEAFGPRNAWVHECLERVRAGGRTDVVVDTDLLFDDGRALSVNLTCVPLVDARDAPIGAMLVVEDITREKRLRSSMSRYVSKNVVDQLLEGGEATLGGSGREVSVLFADIRGFTAISERAPGRATVGLLNDYFTSMVDVVFENDGILDKFVGDMIMAVFGSVRETADDADNAITVANRMITSLRELNVRRAGGEWGTTVRIGVGIATGEVVVGNIGSPKRLEYTVIGDRVSLAERLETANKHYGTSVLLCAATAAKLRRGAALREIDFIRVRGSKRPVAVYEALDHHTDETFPRRAEVLEAFADGLRLYRRREWKAAAERFRAACAAHPGDQPSHVFWRRSERCLVEPPPDNWDGVWAMEED